MEAKLTVEEAWERVLRQIGQSSCREERFIRTAARALALAVLEEAYLRDCKVAACESPACLAHRALGTRLEALGQ